MQHAVTSPRPVNVVLTGASSGIGRATALAFARNRARLAIAARGEEALATVADECRALGAEVLVVPTDVTDATAVQALADAAIARFGHVDVWVNNVGVGVVGLFDRTPIEAHRRVIEANLIGHMNGAHVALGHFRRRGRGVLINMISIAGWAAAPYAAAYSASKFGLRGLSDALRAEMSTSPDVHVCAVYPTFVDTPGMTHGANYTGRNLKPPPPLVDPDIVARCVVAVAGAPQASTYIGSVAAPARLAYALAPGMVGRVAFLLIEAALARAKPVRVTDGNLYSASVGNAVSGGYRVQRRANAIGWGAAAGLAIAGLLAISIGATKGRQGAPRR